MSAYPIEDFIRTGSTVEAYVAEIRKALEDSSAKWDSLVHAFRWYHLGIFACGVDISDVIPASDYQELPPFRMPASSPLIEAALHGDADLLELNHKRLSATQSPQFEAAERTAIRAALLKLLRFLLIGIAGKAEISDFVLEANDVIRYSGGGESQVTCSPLAARLLRLFGNEEVSRTPLRRAATA